MANPALRRFPRSRLLLRRSGLVALLGVCFGLSAPAARADGPYAALSKQIKAALQAAESAAIQERVRREGSNAPTPELGEAVRKAEDFLLHDPKIQAAIKKDR